MKIFNFFNFIYIHKIPENTKDKITAVITAVALIACSFTMYFGFGIRSSSMLLFLFNILFYIAIISFITSLTGNFQSGLIISLSVLGSWGLLNAMIFSMRGTIIMPADITNLRAAKNVAFMYKPHLTWNMLFGLITSVMAFIYALHRCYIPINKNIQLKTGIISFVVLILWLLVCINADLLDRFGSAPTQWEADNASAAGPITYFFSNIRKNSDEPTQYDAKKQANIISGYKTSRQYNPDDLPDIIVIMNEAFSDIKCSTSDLKTDKDYMPFIHSLSNSKNAAVGEMYVSIYGGGTVSTEFEFLTGSTCRFLPPQASPYASVISDTPSLASYLSGIGYETIAMHPFDGEGYCRKTAYPLLGFDNCAFIYEMEKEYRFNTDDYIFDLLRDRAFYKVIEEKVDNFSKPVFSFNVTMQNHGAYERNVIEKIFKKPCMPEPYEIVHTNGAGYPEGTERYLSLVLESDSAFKELTEHYSKKSTKDTIIMMFGDHQPMINGLETKNDEECYKVPYVIWANFKLNNTSAPETSSNYLTIELLKSCGIELPPYLNWLDNAIRKDMPVITAKTIKDDPTYTEETEREILNDYEQMQYYMLHDSQE